MTAQGYLLIGAALSGAFLIGKLSKPDPNESVIDAGVASESRLKPATTSPSEALLLADPELAAAAFSSAVLRLQTSDDFQQALEAILPNYEISRSHEALFMLADAWAAKDPEGAVNRLSRLTFDDPRNPYLFSALGQWAASDPQAAVSWLKAQPSGNDRAEEYLMAGVIRGAAKNDPNLALQILLELPAGPSQLGAVEFITHAWLMQGLETATAGLAKFPAAETRLRERAIRTIIAHAAPHEFDAAKTWARALPSAAERRLATATIAGRWSRTDPRAAVGWIDGMTDSSTQGIAYGEIASRWARSEPLAAQAWLSDHRAEPTYDLATRGVAWSTVGLDHQRAFSQVAEITSAPLREETFEQLGRVWLSEQPMAAKRYLEKQGPIPREIRENLLDSFE